MDRDSHLYRRPSHASQRPYWEPPVLDYRKYEEGGSMYDSLHRHLESALGPERWYEHTDAHIEDDVLRDYSRWISDRLDEARENKNTEREAFYRGLFEEVYGDHFEAEQAYERNLDTMVEEIGDPMPPPERDYEFGVTRTWDTEKKVIRRVVTKFRRVFDPFKNTISLYSDEADEPFLVKKMYEDEGDYQKMLRYVLDKAAGHLDSETGGPIADNDNVDDHTTPYRPHNSGPTGFGDLQTEEGLFKDQKCSTAIDAPIVNNGEQKHEMTDWGFNFCFT